MKSKQVNGILTFGEQAAKWLENGKKRKRKPFRPATAATYACQLEKHLLPLIGKFKLEDVDNRVLKQVIVELTERKLSAASILLNVNILKQIVSSATDGNGNVLYSRTWNSDFVDMPVIENQRRPIASAQAVSDGLKVSDGGTGALIALLAGSGLRINEALAITGSAYPSTGNYWDGEKIIVHVQRTGVGSISSDLKPTKTQAGEREVDLSPELNKYLREKFPYLTTGFLFPQSESFYRQQLVKCGIIGGFHSLRRFRVTHLRLQGIPDALIHFWVGHEDESVTDAYTMVGPEIQKRKDFAKQAGLGFELEAK